MKKIAFLGGGKIGRTMIAHVTEGKKAEVAFVYDPFVKDTDICGVKVVSDITEDMFEGLDLVIECATAEVVAANIVTALKHCDFMPFSMTAFRDDELREKARETSLTHGTRVYLPHGAILGLESSRKNRYRVYSSLRGIDKRGYEALSEKCQCPCGSCAGRNRI